MNDFDHRIIPLVVDLDRTLLKVDTLHESLITLLIKRPWALISVVGAVIRGSAALKAAVQRMNPIDAASLCYRQSVLDRIGEARASGASVHLVTAADQSVADEVSRYLGCFDSAAGSSARYNLKGANKRDFLVRQYPGGFCYAGDSKADLPVWREAQTALLVGAGAKYAEILQQEGKKTEVIPDHQGNSIHNWAKELRLHQWTKNILLFVPLLLGQVFDDWHLLLKATIGFLALGMVASSTYIINDIIDIGGDRRHRTKCNRPLAAGKIQVLHAALATYLMLVVGGGISWLLSPAFFATVLAYLVLTFSYSLALKRMALFDVATIGALFTLRMVMGMVIGHLPISLWAISFSICFFFSLALAKRHVEIMRAYTEGKAVIIGRGYYANDWPLTLAFGVASAVSAIVVLLLFVTDGAGQYAHYTNPEWLFLTPLAVFLWVLRIWLLSHRMQLDDDPIVFALKDKVSYALGLIIATGFCLAI